MTMQGPHRDRLLPGQAGHTATADGAARRYRLRYSFAVRSVRLIPFLSAALRRIRLRTLHLKADQRGFTLLEMVTVLMITGILATLIIVNTSVGNRRQELRDAASAVVNAARNVEGRASASEPVGGTARKAYGVCVTTTAGANANPPRCAAASTATNFTNAYILYARSGTQPVLTTPPTLAVADVLQVAFLPRNYRFSDTDFYFDFVPPQPTLAVEGSYADTVVGVRPELTVMYTQGTACASGADCRTINFRPRAGAIYVE